MSGKRKDYILSLIHIQMCIRDRYYTKENIQEFQRIKELKEQGYQVKAIRMIVHNMSPDAQAEVGAVHQGEKQDLHLSLIHISLRFPTVHWDL